MNQQLIPKGLIILARIFIYDTTLRDGAQAEGISFSSEDKEEVLRRLDDFGMHFVEGGLPTSNPKDKEFFASASKKKLKNTKLVAFGSTRRADNPAEKDAGLKGLAECGAQWICIFGKSWDFHVENALKVTLEENLSMVKESVAFLKKHKKNVIFDAEHFFDGYRENERYAMNVLKAAVDGGADWIVLCDTNGGSLPSYVSDVVSNVVSQFRTPVGIHCHNDSDLAVACSLAAIDSGATMVHGTVNGIGERCGNANLCSIIPNLMLKTGHEVPIDDLTKLTPLSHLVGEIANITPPLNLPYVGKAAFAHKGGMHVSAITKDTRTYEHVPPLSVGNRRRVLISEMSGRASITEKLKELGLSDEDDVQEITDEIKALEAEGYQFEGADASFELLVKKLRNDIDHPFNVVGFRLFIDEIGDKGLISEASIKVMDRHGNVEHTASDGDGPVNALDRALRKALMRFYPVLNNIRLTDYKVRVLDEKAATAAPVRVMIRSTDGTDSWTTVGVSQNVIEASLLALTDSIEYSILKNERRGSK